MACATSISTEQIEMKEFSFPSENYDLTVSKRELFNIKIRLCSGCLNDWTLVAYDSSKVEHLNTTNQDFSCQNCDGGSYNKTFSFTAKDSGFTEIRFVELNLDTLLINLSVE